MAINYAELNKHYAADPVGADRCLRESLETGQIRSSDFNLGRLFESIYGWRVFSKCRSRDALANDVFEGTVTESTGAVNTSMFLNISGQIVYSAILEKYQLEANVFTGLIPVTQATILQGEKIAGINQIGNESAVRNEADPYKLAGVSEDWIFTPDINDRGFIVPVTWEAVFNDRTGVLLERCAAVGEWLGVDRENRAINCIIDENETKHRYNWRGTTIASYGNNTGSHTWDNLEASNALVDWTDLDAADQLFNQMTDPYTGEPFVVDPKHLIVTKQLEKTAMRIVNATEIDVATPGYATTGNPTRTKVGNPYSGKLEIKTSRRLAARLATDTTWFYGDVGMYAKYMQAEPLRVVQAPANNEDEFNRQIIAKYRANERGEYVVVQPRAMVTCTA